MSTPTATVRPDRTPNIDALAEVVEPTTAQEIADILTSCAAEGRAAVPVGGGGALAIGNPTSASAIGISTRRLAPIIDYQPTDMTLSVQAGATLADVSAVLAEQGQMLPIEAPNPSRATIGGLLGTALTGPRRYGGGSLRDVIIGITVAYPDGTVGKAGGLVVKNVSGFDMMRIHHGALGTLGVITSANFKVLPLPRSEFTVLHPMVDLRDSEVILARLQPPSVRPVAMVLHRHAGTWVLAARFEGRESGLNAVASAIGEFLSVDARISNEASAAYWRQYMDERAFAGGDEVRIQIRCLPTEIVQVTQLVLALFERVGTIAGRVEIEPGLGLATLSWHGQPQSDAGVLADIRAESPGATVTILAAPDSLKTSFDVWGDTPDAIELMRRLKNEFDPNRVLNPGRFVGRI